MSASNASATYNILMLAPTMYFADYGCHVRILEEAVVLKELGHTVTILAYPNGRDLWGVDVRRSWGVPFNYRIEVGSSRHKIYLDIMLGLKALLPVLRHKPDIIHAHLHEGGLMGWVLSKLTGAPLVFDFQGSLTSEMLDQHFIKETSIFFKPLAWLEKRINHLGNAVLTSSKHAAQLLEKDFAVPRGRIHPTPDSVNPNIFNPANFSEQDKIVLKQSLGIPLEKQVLVYSGLLTEYQGVGLLLKALQQLSTRRNDFFLLLMGFPAIDHYSNVARDLGVANIVKMTGKMPYENLARHLALGDIAIAPKLSSTEGNGKILNYMSMALPTVAFKTPVSQEYLGEYGVYAEAHSAEALAAAIERALNMPLAQREQTAQALRHHVTTNFTWQKTGQQIEAVYAAVLNGHSQPAVAVQKSSPLKTGQC